MGIGKEDEGYYDAEPERCCRIVLHLINAPFLYSHHVHSVPRGDEQCVVILVGMKRRWQDA